MENVKTVNSKNTEKMITETSIVNRIVYEKNVFKTKITLLQLALKVEVSKVQRKYK